MHPLLLLLALAALTAAEPAPATIIREGGRPITGAFILAETIDGIDYVLDASQGENAKSSLKRSTYLRVDYGATKDPFFDVGQELLGKGELAKAAERFERVARGTPYDWVRETALLRLAEIRLRQERPADAVAAIAQLEQRAPRSPRLIEGLYLRGRAQSAAGDAAAAAATFAALGKRTEAGPQAAALAARGAAALARAAGRHADAAQAMAPVLAGLDPAADARMWAGMALEMAGDLAAVPDAAQALDWYGRVAWSAAPGPDRARGLLGIAAVRGAGTTTADLLAAFDAACMAVHGVPGAGDAIPDARTTVRTLAGRIDRDPGVSDADKRLYRTYAAK
jgi:TolA-binding protein